MAKHTYDKASNITSEHNVTYADWEYDAPILNRVTDYTYDERGRLTGSTVSDFEQTTKENAYFFDAVGNRRIHNDNGFMTYSNYNGLNQLTTTDAEGLITTYTYDQKGNQVEIASEENVKTFVYDTENQMTEALIGTESINTNTYNSAGQRIQRSDLAGITDYYYLDNTLLYTTDNTGAKTSVNLTDPTGNVIATKNEAVNSMWLFYNQDIRNSTIAITDQWSETELYYLYSDWGQTEEFPGWYNAGIKPVNDRCYTAGIWDRDTDLYYLNARYYDPIDGVFTIADSVRNGGGIAGAQSLYGYCEGDPIGATDPSGHKKKGLKNFKYNSYYKPDKCLFYILQRIIQFKRGARIGKKATIAKLESLGFSNRLSQMPKNVRLLKKHYKLKSKFEWNVLEFEEVMSQIDKKNPMMAIGEAKISGKKWSGHAWAITGYEDNQGEKNDKVRVDSWSHRKWVKYGSLTKLKFDDDENLISGGVKYRGKFGGKMQTRRLRWVYGTWYDFKKK